MKRFDSLEFDQSSFTTTEEGDGGNKVRRKSQIVGCSCGGLWWSYFKEELLVNRQKFEKYYKKTAPAGVVSATEYLYTGHEKEIIPREAKKVVVHPSVTVIKPNAFQGHPSIQEVRLSMGVTMIGRNAFLDCSNLVAINLPDSLKDIGENAFKNCSSLKSVSPIPEHILIIRDGLFDGCKNLQNIDFEGHVHTIGKYAFASSGLICLEMPSSLKVVDQGAFEHCKSLINMTMPAVREIGDFSFSGCSKMSTVFLPNTLACIGNEAFAYCDCITFIKISEEADVFIKNSVFKNCLGLKSVHFPKSVKGIGNNAFRQCRSLVSLSLPYGIKSIQRGFCNGCENLICINIPTSVVSIGVSAFKQCTSLRQLILPNSIVVIHPRAFYSCSGLESLSVEDRCKPDDTDAMLPSSLAAIGEESFAQCSSLTFITLPAHLRYMVTRAFESYHILNFA